jgi:hypothetical protein
MPVDNKPVDMEAYLDRLTNCLSWNECSPLFVETYNADKILLYAEVSGEAWMHPTLKASVSESMKNYEKHLFRNVLENLRHRCDLFFEFKYGDFFDFYRERIERVNVGGNDKWFELFLKHEIRETNLSDSLGYYSIVPRVSIENEKVKVEFGHDIYPDPNNDKIKNYDI